MADGDTTRARRWLRRVLILLLVLALLVGVVVAGVALWARQRVNDGAVAVLDTLATPPVQPQQVLAVFAHPDDEVAMAGTIAKLTSDGIPVTALYLTRGQAAKTRPEGTSDDELGRLREQEVRRAADALGIDEVLVRDYPDGGLEPLVEELTEDIGQLIEQLQPDLVLTYDDAVGLYGHPDHRAASRATQEAISAAVAAGVNPVRNLYVVTLPQSMIEVALQVSSTFANNYPEDPELGLPSPSVAVRITSKSSQKYAALRSHQTQAPVLGDVQPGIDFVPGWLYYRVFDREYFAELPVNDLRPRS